MNYFAIAVIGYICGYFYVFPALLEECEKDIIADPTDDIKKLELKLNTIIGTLWWPVIVTINLFKRFGESWERLSIISRINSLTRKEKIAHLSSGQVFAFGILPLIILSFFIYLAFTYKS